MADETPSDPTPHRAPVRMGLRVVARHAAGRHGGAAVAHEVVESHRPKHLPASTRLSPVAARAAAPPPPPAPPASSFVAAPEAAAPGFAAAPTAAAAAPSARGGPEVLPAGMTDFAADWL